MKPRNKRNDSGFATVLVLVLVFLLIALVMANARVLAHMKSELKRVEARQLRRALPPRPPVSAKDLVAPQSPAEGTQP